MMERVALSAGRCGPECVEYSGDSENDLPMLEYADISVAMGNGVKEVKEKADYVTDKIDNDGLYKAFKYLKLFQNQK